MLNYVYCKRAKDFAGDIDVGKAHEIEYQLTRDRSGNIWIKMQKATVLNIQVGGIDTTITLKASDVKEAYIQKCTATKDVAQPVDPPACVTKSMVASTATTTTAPASVASTEIPAATTTNATTVVSQSTVAAPVATTTTISTTVVSQSKVETAPSVKTTEIPALSSVQPNQQTEGTNSSASSSYEPINLHGTIFAVTRYDRNKESESKAPVANFYLHNKERNEIVLVLIRGAEYPKYASLLNEGHGVEITDVEERTADVKLMPSTMKNYTYFYVVTNTSNINAIPSHPIDIDIIKDHFNLWSIERVHESHFTRNSPRICVCKLFIRSNLFSFYEEKNKFYSKS